MPAVLHIIAQGGVPTATGGTWVWCALAARSEPGLRAYELLQHQACIAIAETQMPFSGSKRAKRACQLAW